MRIRSRDGMWNRRYSAGQTSFPTSYTSFLYGSTKYYSPWTSLCQAVQDNAAVYTADNSYTATAEQIIDEGGPPHRQKSNKAYVWNGVIHTRVSCGTSPFQCVSSRSGARKVEGAGLGVKPPTIASCPATPVLSPYDKMVAYSTCYNALIPEFESDVSLANFIYELKDFKSLLRHFGKGVDTISSVARDVRHSVAPAPRPVRRRHESESSFRNRLIEWQSDRKFFLGDTASSLDLTYHYAVRPFVNDVSAMITSWGGLTGAIRKLNHQGSVRNVRHGVYEANPTHSVSGTTQSRLVTSTRSVYRLTGEMTYRLRPMSQLDAFMVWSGLRVTPKKLWDMVPFSFVLDHFCTMGEALASFDRSEVDFNLTRLLESVKSESAVVNTYHPTYQVYTYFAGGGAGDATELFQSSPYNTYYPLAWVHRLSYVREGIVPQYVRPPILPRLQIPSMDSVRLDLDLMYQNFFRGKGKPSWRTD